MLQMQVYAAPSPLSKFSCVMGMEWHSRRPNQEELLGRASLPPALEQQLVRCRPPPPFHLQDPYLAPGEQPGHAKYSDPEFVRHEWARKVLQRAEEDKQLRLLRRREKKKALTKTVSYTSTATVHYHSTNTTFSCTYNA